MRALRREMRSSTYKAASLWTLAVTLGFEIALAESLALVLQVALDEALANAL